MLTGLADVDIIALAKRVLALEKKAGIKPPKDDPIGTHVIYEDRADGPVPTGPRAPEDELRVGNEEHAPRRVDGPERVDKDGRPIPERHRDPWTGQQSIDTATRRETSTPGRGHPQDSAHMDTRRETSTPPVQDKQRSGPAPGVTTSETLDPKERR